MKKIKKYLLTSLSLGIVGVTTGVIIASCANQASENTPATNNPSTTTPPANQNNNPDPRSVNSIKTEPGQSLTDSQNEYHQQLAAEIQKEYNENSKLNYDNVDQKQIIDNKIQEYVNALSSNNILKPWKDVIETLPFSFYQWSSEQIKSYESVAGKQYNDFPQKNLLPQENDIKFLLSLDLDNAILINGQNIDNKTNKFSSWQSLTFGYINFYADPKSVILLEQLLIKQNATKRDAWYYKLLDSSLFAVISYQQFNEESPVYKAGEIYISLFEKLDGNILSPTPTNNNSNPMTSDSLVTIPGEPLTLSQKDYH